MPISAALPQPPPFSPVILLTMLLVLGASSVILWLLTRRATDHRQWVELSDWASQHGFHARPERRPVWRLRHYNPPLPAPLRRIDDTPPRIGEWLCDKRWTDADAARTTFLRLHPSAAERPTPNAAPPPVWNLMLRRLPTSWPPTGLRPAANAASLLDRYPLTSFPDLSAVERFMLFGTDPGAADVLAASSLGALLPHDVGLLIHGHYLILDFSARPFDPLELSRLLALADQLAANVPAREGEGVTK